MHDRYADTLIRKVCETDPWSSEGFSSILGSGWPAPDRNRRHILPRFTSFSPMRSSPRCLPLGRTTSPNCLPPTGSVNTACEAALIRLPLRAPVCPKTPFLFDTQFPSVVFSSYPKEASYRLANWMLEDHIQEWMDVLNSACAGKYGKRASGDA